MLLLLMGYGASASAVVDAQGLAYPEEVMLYGMSLEEIPHTASLEETQRYASSPEEVAIYASNPEEVAIYGSQLDEQR